MIGMTLFTGFDGAGIGMQAAGIEIVAGIEHDPQIAEVARANGHPVKTADILNENPADYLGIQALHASPPCTRASVANASAEENEDGLKEAPMDIALAEKTIQFIEALRPEIVTIENVWGYRKFQSFKGGRKCEGILPVLERLGYWVDVKHLNSADFGVPQTRKRLILRAVRGGMVPHLPAPETWRGWYGAIEDLIPTLPESEFAPWQLERLPAELKTFLVGGANTSAEQAAEGVGVSEVGEPTRAVNASNANQWRAFLVSPIDGLIREHGEPSQTIVSSAKTVEPRAFIMQGGNESTRPIFDNEPISTIGSVNRVGNIPRAFLVNGALSGQGKKTLQIHDEREPTGTIVSSMNSVKDTRAWLSQGRVVKMTPRALARFQSFPDAYELPDKAALACKGIGNAVPPLLMRRVYETFDIGKGA